MMKIFIGSLDLMKDPAFLDARKTQEKQWREDFAAMKEKGAKYVAAMDDIDAACRDLRKDAVLSELCDGPNSRLFGLARSLNNFADAMRFKNEDESKAAAKSFEQFLGQLFEPGKPLNLNLEKASFVAWLETVKANLPADSALLKLALADGTAEEATLRILEGAEPLTQISSVSELLSKGTEGVEKADIALLAFMRDLLKFAEANGAGRHEAEARYKKSHELLQRGLAEVYGAKLQPDASSTLRLGWGKISGYQEAGKKIASTTTFGSMLALADARKGAVEPYAISEKFKAGAGASICRRR